MQPIFSLTKYRKKKSEITRLNFQSLRQVPALYIHDKLPGYRVVTKNEHSARGNFLSPLTTLFCNCSLHVQPSMRLTLYRINCIGICILSKGSSSTRAIVLITQLFPRFSFVSGQVSTIMPSARSSAVKLCSVRSADRLAEAP